MSRFTPPAHRIAALDATHLSFAIWPLRIMCMSSMPAMVDAADRNDLKPSIGRTTRLTERWSCSTMLFRYFDLTDFDVCLMFRVVTFERRRVGAALVDRNLLGNTVLTNRLAQEPQCSFTIALAVNKKSTVPPILSTARYKYFQRP